MTITVDMFKAAAKTFYGLCEEGYSLEEILSKMDEMNWVGDETLTGTMILDFCKSLNK